MLQRLAPLRRHCFVSRRAFSVAQEDVLVSRSDNGVFATITINRPQVHNCLSPSVMEGLNAALSELKGEGNDKLRAVFLKAEGQTFCAGGDLKVRFMRSSDHCM
jgi:enoyl-CoA hydratase/carnithine racemase